MVINPTLFPFDSLNVRADIVDSGSSSLVSLSSTSTVLYESFNTNANNGSLVISCGAVRLLTVNEFSHVNSIERFKFARCPNGSTLLAEVFNAGANTTTTVSVIYSPTDLSLATSTDPSTALINTNLQYLVVLMAAVGSLLLLNFVRLLFLSKRHL